jgi:hypothetical protein
MSMWLDFLQVTLALGLGWLAWTLLAVTHPLGSPFAWAASRRKRRAYAPRPGSPVMNGQVVDSDR